MTKPPNPSSYSSPPRHAWPPNAWYELARRLLHARFSRLRSYDIDDILQDAALTYNRAILRGSSPGYSLFRKIVMDQAADFRRKYRREAKLFRSTLEDVSNHLEVRARGPYDRLVHHEHFQIAHAAVGLLCPQDREIFFCILNGEPRDQIASQLGISRGALRKRISRIRQYLAAVINRQYGIN